MTIDFYAEPQDEMKDGAFYHGVITRGDWGMAHGFDNKGKGVIRVFGLDDQDKAGIKSKQMKLGSPATLEGLFEKGGYMDLPTPKGSDPGKMASDLLQRVYHEGAPTEGAIRSHASRSAMTMFGMSEPAATEASFRRTYDEIRTKVETAFDGQGPKAFADKPSKQMAVLQGLKEDLGVAMVPDVKPEDAKKPTSNAPIKPTISASVPIGRLGR